MSVNHQPLSRTSSSSSVLSDGTATETSTNDELPLGSTTNIPSSSSTSSTGAPTESAAPKRTRKRFTNAQLTLLEDLFHQTSHPTRDQRDKLAKEAGLEIRSVTVWFQNKRQTERKVALSNGTAPPSIRKRHDSHSSNIISNNPTPHPLRSASSTPSISTPKSGRVGPRHQRTHSSSTMTTTTTTTGMGIGMVGTQHRYPSLDDIASRSERPQFPSVYMTPRTPTRIRTYSSPNVTSNSTHQQQIPSHPSAFVNSTSTSSLSVVVAAVPRGCEPSSSGEGGGERPLWENMPSSPLGPSSPERRRDRDLLDFGMGRRGLGGRRTWTLEWACAKARVKGSKNFDEEKGDEEGVGELRLEDDEDQGEEKQGKEDGEGEDEDEDEEDVDRTIRSSRQPQQYSCTSRSNPLVNELGVRVHSNPNPEDETEEMDLDTMGGDTEDDEGDPPHEALTPSSSISLGTHSSVRINTRRRHIVSVNLDKVGIPSRSVSSQSIGIGFGESSSREDYATLRARGRGKKVSGKAKEREKEFGEGGGGKRKGSVHDEEMMDAALALCGLGRRGSS